MLTLRAPITSAADDSHKFFYCFSEKLILDDSSESSARQRIHKKPQALFSSKDESKKLKCRLLQFLFGPLKVKVDYSQTCLYRSPKGMKNSGCSRQVTPKYRFICTVFWFRWLLKRSRDHASRFDCLRLEIQSTLVISKSKGPAETLRDIRTSTYQTCRIEENTKRTTKFHT